MRRQPRTAPASANLLTNLCIAASTVVLLVVLDRVLLVILGLPPWMADAELHYVHRPGFTGVWKEQGRIPVTINRLGLRDDEFPVAKPPNEARILDLGDSIAMGHRVTESETYSSKLEALLNGRAAGTRSFQVINAGVQGYATFQELGILRRSMVFEPDMVTLQFCLNDVIEPFVVNREYGGRGFDYHRVVQTRDRWASYLLNETGFGRLLHELRLRVADVVLAGRREIADVRAMIANPEAPEVRHNWEVALRDLEEAYAFAREHDIPFVLLVFPFRFQLNRPAQQWPQARLREHADRHNVPYIDFTPVFEERMRRDSAPADLYFVDVLHLSPTGHAVVAEVLADYIDGRL